MILSQKSVTIGILTFFFCLTVKIHLQADQDIGFQGELTGWGVATDADPDRQELGIRYLPQLKLNYPISEAFSVDSELMANFYRVQISEQGEETEEVWDEKAYRLWIRLYTDQFESRLGLQEISFGPGRILRSLRWFDQKDSRDPTNYTDGVKALLLRYYLENNTNFWGWSLYGNDDPMGISPLTSDNDRYEYGGRCQIPVSSGEIGFSAHQRWVDLNPLLSESGQEFDPLLEKRFGFDITWDLVAGLWLEYTHLELESNGFIPEIQQFATVGTDYTFEIGNGVGAILEYQVIHLESDDIVLEEDTFGTLAVSLQYPLNLLDSIRFMAFQGVNTGVDSYQIDWKRTYDTIMIDLVLFQTMVDSSSASTVSMFANESPVGDETGLRLLVQFNH
ncbi:hypothetical protein KJ966_06385 [bacterium]|nr:hypothetical protein [bacterium]